MDISCHSFVRMARLAEPLMRDGGALFTMSYYGAEKVVEHYNVMGPVKAALESAVRYLAYELGPRGFAPRHLAGTSEDAAASGIEHFDELVERPPNAHPPESRQHRGCRHGDRVPCDRLRQADHRGNGLRRWRIPHRRIVRRGGGRFVDTRGACTRVWRRCSDYLRGTDETSLPALDLSEYQRTLLI